MTNWTHMAALVGKIPDLPGARCKGEADLYEATVGVRPVDGRPAKQETEAARDTALRLCATCPALDSCRAWLAAQPPSRRPRGVIAGEVITSTWRPSSTRATAEPAGGDCEADR